MRPLLISDRINPDYSQSVLASVGFRLVCLKIQKKVSGTYYIKLKCFMNLVNATLKQKEVLA